MKRVKLLARGGDFRQQADRTNDYQFGTNCMLCGHIVYEFFDVDIAKPIELRIYSNQPKNYDSMPFVALSDEIINLFPNGKPLRKLIYWKAGDWFVAQGLKFNRRYYAVILQD